MPLTSFVVFLCVFLQAQPATQESRLVAELRLADTTIGAGEAIGVEVALTNVSGADLWIADDLLPSRSHETLLRLADHRYLALERRTGEGWVRVSDECGYGGVPWPERVKPQRLAPGESKIVRFAVGGICKPTFTPGAYRVIYQRDVHVLTGKEPEADRLLGPSDPYTRLTSAPVEFAIADSAAAPTLEAARRALLIGRAFEVNMDIEKSRSELTDRPRMMATLMQALAAEQKQDFKRAAELYRRITASRLGAVARVLADTVPQN